MRTARLLLAIALAANGLAMIFMPAIWYAWVPGVSATGALNPHFVRDIGCAYLVAGAAFVWLVFAASRAWPTALAGATFLTLHALVHLAEVASGRQHLPRLLADLPGVFLLPALALWLSWPFRRKLTTEETSNAALDHQAPARRL